MKVPFTKTFFFDQLGDAFSMAAMWSARSLPTAARAILLSRADLVQLGDHLGSVSAAGIVIVGDHRDPLAGQRRPVGQMRFTGAHRRAHRRRADSLGREHVLLAFNNERDRRRRPGRP